MVGPFAGTFWDTSALATCTRNFPAERGTVIGIVKACMGAALAAATRHMPHLAPARALPKASRQRCADGKMAGRAWMWLWLEDGGVGQGRTASPGRILQNADSRGEGAPCAHLLLQSWALSARSLDITSWQQQKPCTGLIRIQLCDWGERAISSAGLSGAVYTSLYVGFLQPDTLGLLLFIAIVPTAVVLIAACFVNHVPFVQAKEAATPTGEPSACRHALVSTSPGLQHPRKALFP